MPLLPSPPPACPQVAVKVLSSPGTSSSLEEEFPDGGEGPPGGAGGAAHSGRTHPLFDSLQKVGGRSTAEQPELACGSGQEEVAAAAERAQQGAQTMVLVLTVWAQPHALQHHTPAPWLPGCCRRRP